MIEFTEEQQKAWRRYMAAWDNVGLGNKRRKGAWIPQSDVLGSVKADGMHHPLFIPNEAWSEFKAASEHWKQVQPRHMHDERLRMTQGDYGTEDSWDTPAVNILDTYDQLEV